MSDSDILNFGAGGLLDSMPAHWEENYLGVWAIHDGSLREFVDRYGSVNIPVHIQASASEIRAELQRIRGGYAVEVNEGVAVVNLSGSTSKHYNSFSRSTSTLMMRRTLRVLRRTEDIEGVVIHIDSPGGAVAGQKAFADEIKALADEKPTYAFIEDMGCSAAYWSASQCSRVYANDMAIVGSIGTYGVVYDSSKMAEDVGIKVHVIKAGEMKGAGVEGTAVTDEHLAKFQYEVDTLNEFFIDAVASGRPRVPAERVRELATGDVWIGKAAVDVGLVDEIGTLSSVVSALVDEIEASNSATGLSQNGDGMSNQGQELEDRVAELEASLAESQTAASEAAAQVQALESEARISRFESLVGSGVTAWAGERSVHLQMLGVLSEAYGEDSAEFGAYVRQQKALTAQLAASALLESVGRHGGVEGGTAVSRIEAMAKELAAKSGITYEAAYTQVLTQDPMLYAAYVKETA